MYLLHHSLAIYLRIQRSGGLYRDHAPNLRLEDAICPRVDALLTEDNLLGLLLPELPRCHDLFVDSDGTAAFFRDIIRIDIMLSADVIKIRLVEECDLVIRSFTAVFSCQESAERALFFRLNIYLDSSVGKNEDDSSLFQIHKLILNIDQVRIFLMAVLVEILR